MIQKVIINRDFYDGDRVTTLYMSSECAYLGYPFFQTEERLLMTREDLVSLINKALNEITSTVGLNYYGEEVRNFVNEQINDTQT